MRMAARLERIGTAPHYAGTTKTVNGKPVWTGKLARASEKTLTAPLRWKKPRAIFVNSMGDLIHEDVPDEWIDQVFAVMARARQHIFKILTKRAERMREYMTKDLVANVDRAEVIEEQMNILSPVEMLSPYQRGHDKPKLPLPNVWLGVSLEDQKRATRIFDLLHTPATVRFISCEPALGPIDLKSIDYDGDTWFDAMAGWSEKDIWNSVWDPSITGENLEDSIAGFEDEGFSYPPSDKKSPCLDWVIAGGESGPNARPMHPDWVRFLRDQCANAGVPFFFKQWGEWLPNAEIEYGDVRYGEFHGGIDWVESCLCREGDQDTLYRVGKSRAGRHLDGVEHSAFPTCLEVKNA